MSRSCLMIIEPGLQLWGSERALAATLAPLCDHWDKVLLVTPPRAELIQLVNKTEALRGRITLAEASIGNLHQKGRLARIGAMAGLARLMLRHRPNRVYLNQAGLVRLLQPITKLRRTSLVVHVRLIEDVARVAPRRGQPGAPLHQIYISDAVMEGAPSPDDGLTHVYNAYDPFDFRAEAPEPQTHLADFVDVGRLAHGKGQHLLVEALAHPDIAARDYTAHFFGEGVRGDSYATDLTARAETLNLGDRAVFHGFQKDVTARLPDYGFLVSTSHFEPLGRVVMEAWDAGLVPIAFAGSGGAAEMVRKSGGGLLYDDWTGDSLSDALLRAAQMPEDERRQMAARGLDWARDALGLDHYRDLLEQALFPKDI